MERTGTYSLVMALIRQSHFGAFEFLLDGKKAGRNLDLDLYHSRMSSREYALPPSLLEAGEHVLTVRNLCKSHQSTGYCLGLDAILLVLVE